MSDFSHLDEAGRPSMVDVGHKAATERFARAQAIVLVGEEILSLLEDGDIQTKKGSVFQTASLAGIMAAKKTSDLIPLCHPLALSKVAVDIQVNAEREIVVECTAKLVGQTGVEMEALTGASIAALTIYDMCKALSHHIRIKETRLLEKTGGKQDFKA